MSDLHPKSTASVAGHPVHPMLVPFPIAFFTAALVTDIAYWWTANLMWANFSAWLIAAGLLIGAIAALIGLIDFVGSRGVRSQRSAWLHLAGNVVVLVLALINSFVHARDGWTSVVPTGLILSCCVVLVLLFTGWLGSSLVYRHGVGVVP